MTSNFVRQPFRQLSKNRNASAALLPRLESLEDRIALSTMSVVNLYDSGPGSLRQAIIDANDAAGHDTIEFARELEGTIGLTSGQLEITDDLTIEGPGQNELTVSGNDLSRVFDIANADVAIRELTISDGFGTDGLVVWGSGGGAGIRVTQGSLHLDDVHLENNRIVDSVFAGGAAIQNRGGDVSLVDVVLSNNEASGLFFAGGGAIHNEGTLSVEDSKFENNVSANHPANTQWATGGGAINNSAGQVTITNSRFVNNQVDGMNAGGYGGAIQNLFGSLLVVHDSHFSSNTAQGSTARGGAISNWFGGLASISESRFVDNSVVGAVALGGAISNSLGGSMTIEDSSVADNLASGDLANGGGIYVGAGTHVVMSDTIVKDNQAVGNVGMGGGIFIAGTLDADESKIKDNAAATSHDDVFGVLTIV